MAQVSLVAFYGPKERRLDGYVAALQDRLCNLLGGAFKPYAPEQVHGTIIGLEGERDGERVLNRGYLECRGERRAMDFTGVLDVVGRESDLLPLNLCLGGFADGADYAFTSRGIHPYKRSFSIQGDTAVAMGWPVQGDAYPPSLDRLRRAFNGSNVLHKYHVSDGDVDNDFFFVLGRVDRAVTSEQAIRDTQQDMRRYMSTRDPLILELDRDSLGLVAYSDAALPWTQCRVYGLDEARRHISQIKSLYGAAP